LASPVDTLYLKPVVSKQCKWCSNSERQRRRQTFTTGYSEIKQGV